MATTDDGTSNGKEHEYEESQCEDEILTISEKISTATKQKILLKLHKQFGQVSTEKLQRLLKSLGNKDIECGKDTVKTTQCRFNQ